MAADAGFPNGNDDAMVELPLDLLFVPETATVKESSPSYSDLAE
jgi:hypothetical protein